jgi:SAM-dependent methyltransferase/uncharacterized protein YbaR (Trm112 family)
MNRAVLDLMVCPNTKGALRLEAFQSDGDEVEYGVLQSEAGDYPIVAGIPIMLPKQEALLALLKDERYQDAVALAAFGESPKRGLWKASEWLESTYRLRGVGRSLSTAWRERMLRHTTGVMFPPAETQPGPQRLFQLAYHELRLRPSEVYNYNYYRYGMPRHLTALSFIEAITPDAAPVLDLGCGAGHITWALQQRISPRPVIGFDGFFFSLYVARTRMVQQGNFICGDILALPFRSEIFSLIYCSDAFYLPTCKWPMLREMERVLRDEGQMMLVALRNQLRQHFYNGQPIFSGRPLTLAGYRQLVGHLAHRFIPDSLTVQRYLDGVGLPAGTQASDNTLEGELNFSILAAKRDSDFTDGGKFPEWPHARGKLGINPLYRVSTVTPKEVSYVREFPSGVYAEEHKEMRKFLPEKFSLPADELQALRENRPTNGLKPLIDKLAIMGFPPGYLPEGIDAV